MRKLFLLLLLSIVCLPVAVAQKDSSDVRAKTNTLLFGFGHCTITDTYLSPYSYKGSNFRLISESLKDSRSRRFARQHWLSLDYTHATNYSGRGLYHAGFIQYDFSLLRNYRLSDNLSLMLGGASDLLLGGIYNVRNSNNPVQAKVNLNLDFSGMLDYRFHVKGMPLVLNYQVKIPVAGAGFAPEYGESYYEIFDLGNSSGIVQFFSLHNQWSFQNEVTVELPLPKHSLRIGYLSNILQTRINHIETSVITHSFLLGISGDILRLDRRKRISQGEF